MVTTFPIININGTSAQALSDFYYDAMIKLQEARKLIAENSPHGRDYPGHPEALLSARAEHFARLKAIDTMIEDFANLGAHANSRIK
jgi:hypothetical protein